MSGRQIVIVDVESSGLRSEDIAVEVAWRNVQTGESGEFVPRHSVGWVLQFGQPKALEINGYRERIAGRTQDDGTESLRLFRILDGAAMCGSNIRQDAEWMEQVFIGHLDVWDVDFSRSRPHQPWHHRMPDLASYAAGVLGISPADLPGLWTVCELLGIEPESDIHTAAAGAAKTEECLRVLADKAGVQL